jgi:hypothetical protein
MLLNGASQEKINWKRTAGIINGIYLFINYCYIIYS